MLLLVVRCQEIASKEFIFKIFPDPVGSFAPSALAIPGCALKVRPPPFQNLGSAPDVILNLNNFFNIFYESALQQSKIKATGIYSVTHTSLRNTFAYSVEQTVFGTLLG
jgi:hypothetical protein